MSSLAEESDIQHNIRVFGRSLDAFYAWFRAAWQRDEQHIAERALRRPMAGFSV
jgi:hypothetical protein